MKWLDYLKSWTGVKGRETLADQLVQVDPTANYHATSFYASELIVDQLPMFTLRHAQLMVRSDPIVKFALNIRNAALAALDIEIKAKDQRVANWLKKSWSTLWNNHRSKVTRTKKAGFQALQIMLARDAQGLLQIDDVKEFAPQDVRALESGGKVNGFKVRARGEVKMHMPRACWLTYDSEYGCAYGNALTRAMYPPWYEKWMPKGAKKLAQLRMIKDSYIGDIFWFPFGQNVTLPPETPGGVARQVSWRDVARGIAEQRLSGNPLTLPMILNPNPGGTGSTKMLEYQPPQAIAGGEHTFDWVEHLNEDILRAADISIEVVKAQENGGFSGRSIPFMVLLANGDQEAVDIVQQIDFQVFRPLAWLNFGGDPEYEIRPKSLVESFAKDSSGSAMGGSAIGSPAGQRPAPQPGQEQPQQAQGQRSAQFSESHQFSSTQFDLPGDLAFEVRMLGERIATDDLADDGRELNPHITVKFGLTTDSPDDVRRAVLGMSPVAVQFGKASIFANDEHDVVKIDIESKGLHALNAAIAKLPNGDIHPSYMPHCTIAYVRKGLGEMYAARLNDLEGRTAVFDRLIFSDKNRQRISIPLSGAADFAEDNTAEADRISSRAASRAFRRIKSAAELIRELKKNDLTPRDLATEIESLLRGLDRTIGNDLSASMMAGNLIGQAEGLTSIPPVFVPPTIDAGSGGAPPSEPPDFSSFFPDDEPPPSFPALADAIEVLHASPAVSSSDYLSAAQAVREGAFTITADISDGAVAEVREILARGLEEGIGTEEFAERVIEKLGSSLSEAHINNIFRTNTAAAMSDGHERALANPMVSDAFPYRAYFATTDQRVRRAHIALEHLGLNSTNIYRADDPTWLRFRPPWDYGCRCSWAPQTVEQAARAGVQEAIDWLARAKDIAAANGGDFHEYLGQTAPPSPEFVQSPSFEPPEAFRRA